MSPAPPCSPVTSRSMLRSSEAGAALGLPEEAGEGGEDGGCLAGAGVDPDLTGAIGAGRTLDVSSHPPLMNPE